MLNNVNHTVSMTNKSKESTNDKSSMGRCIAWLCLLCNRCWASEPWVLLLPGKGGSGEALMDSLRKEARCCRCRLFYNSNFHLNVLHSQVCLNFEKEVHHVCSDYAPVGDELRGTQYVDGPTDMCDHHQIKMLRLIRETRENRETPRMHLACGLC